MTQASTPEAILAKVNSFISQNDPSNAMFVIDEFLNNSKKKIFSPSMETLIITFIELAINENKNKYLREALNFYRSLTQVSNIDSFTLVLSKTKELVEDKFVKAVKSFQGVQIEINDLDEEEQEDFLFDYAAESKEKEDLVQSQKFIWETYKILLDITKTNSKLFNLYSEILRAAFTFCKENKRTLEFKRLCDSVRNYLQTLIKSEKKQNFLNKVQLSQLDVLRILIKVRLNQLETATALEQWSESFKTAEDIVYLFERYEKHSTEDKNKKPNSTGNNDTNASTTVFTKPRKGNKLNPTFKLEFYSYIEKLFFISNYPLYHAYANVLVRDIGNKAIMGYGEKAKEKLEKFNLHTFDNKIILSTLATPLKNTYTNYLKIGEDMYETQNDIETDTCKRMMNILKLTHVPSRNQLINYINNNNILSTCSEEIKNLYNLLQNETNPITIAKKGVKYIQALSNIPHDDNYIEKYMKHIKENLIIKCIYMFSKSFTSISFERINKLFTPFGLTSIEIEDLIAEISRNGYIKCKIDHSLKMILFITLDTVTESFNKNIYDLIIQLKCICEDISKYTNPNKYEKIYKKIYENIMKTNNNSLKNTESILKEIKLKSEELTAYLIKKSLMKSELAERNINLKEKQRLEKLQKEQFEKEELTNKQQLREYDIQIKKKTISMLREFTNSIIIDNKRIKLDDLLKDLSKASFDALAFCLGQQEIAHAQKKEKKLNQVTTDIDYVLREFRSRDNKEFVNKLTQEEETFNKLLEENSMKYYKEKIGMKETLNKFKEFKDNYFEKLKKEKRDKYNEEMNAFKIMLKKKIDEDAYNEIKVLFKKYLDDFKQREEEAAKQKKDSSTWRRGAAYGGNKEGTGFTRGMKYEDKRKDDIKKEAPKDWKFERGAKAEESKREYEAEKAKQQQQNQQKDLGFTRGSALQQQDNKPFQRGSQIASDNKPQSFQRGGALQQQDNKPQPFTRGGAQPQETKTQGFQRGGALQQDSKPQGFQRGGALQQQESKPQPFTRGGAQQQESKPQGFQRGAALQQDNKTQGFQRGANAQAPKSDTGFQRGANVQKKK